MRIVLTCHGRRDIPSSCFDQDQPVTVDLGVPILDVLDSHSHPVGAQEPRAAASGTTLRIGPGRIRAGARITYHFLTNGACSSLLHQLTVAASVLALGRQIVQVEQVIPLVETLAKVDRFQNLQPELCTSAVVAPASAK